MEIKTKFNIGDEVWSLSENRLMKRKIKQIIINNGISYVFDDSRMSLVESLYHLPILGESCCFATKNDLIAYLLGDKNNYM